MNHQNLKKRRPHGHGEISVATSTTLPAASVPFASTSCSSSSSLSTPLPSSQPPVPAHTFYARDKFTAQEYQVLQHAASVLNCTLDQLLVLDQRHSLSSYQTGATYPSPTPKRQRLDTELIQSIPPAPRLPEQQAQYQEMPGGFFRSHVPEGTISEESPSLVQCLTNFSVCSPCSGSAYDPPTYAPTAPMPTYDYLREKHSYCDNEPPQTHFHHEDVAHGVQPDIFKNPDLEASSLPSYPPLEPSRGLMMQPSTRSENMIYKSPEPGHRYVGTPQDDLVVVGCGVPADVHGERRASDVHGSGPQDSSMHESADRSRELGIVLSAQRPPAAKRGPFRSNDERERTAETRKIGSCIRCRMQRIRCEIDPDDKHGTCLTCQRVSSVKIWRLPCLRYKITDVRLFKPGPVKGYEWTRRWTEGVPGDISLWDSPDTKYVRVTEGYTNHSIVLRVRRFVPQDGDSLTRTWVANGQKREVKIPAYAIVDLDEAKNAYDDYIRSGYYECCKTILNSKAKLLHATYLMAIKAAQDPKTPEKERELLTKALRLWMAIRLTTKSTVIVGAETLGMARDIMDSTSPLHGQIPLPPVMGAQLELVLIHQIQSTLRRELLENLQSMTQANKHKTWFTTYLVTFILLHNVALLCQHDAGYARKHGIKRRFAREDMVQDYQTGANILLAYFHYCTKGVYPFSSECKDQDLATLAELDESKTKVVMATRKVVKDQRNQWAKIRQSQDYENDLFYISQMYEEHWSPLPTI
ncbi:hypothetical protein Micbo1qcDRAFT_26801 [Microdochium bolleyi]|uniref:Zn(2)-C6 fungal-type domain-containing protein n=1 Tax=Microdochium bolleyi TaxID=196109 RepID=A0A136JEB7_9PEZI|nr:hypothetical protein Micbo1qcDRAFT_26801 [Microdochium bolleyi]